MESRVTGRFPVKQVFILVLCILFLGGWGCSEVTRWLPEKQTGASETGTVPEEMTATSETAAPEDTAMPSETATVPEDTPIPSETPTPLPPTETPTELPPTPTLTARPSPTRRIPTSTRSAAALSLKGPWLLMAGEKGLWAANADGSGLTLLTSDIVVSPHNLSKAIAPHGSILAYVTYGLPSEKRDLVLKFLKLPDGTVLKEIHLTSQKTEPQPGAGAGDNAYEAGRAISETDSIAWSPDGKTLAFIGAQEGSTADLYIYSLERGRAVRLTSEPSQAFHPTWSPDGVYIVYWGANSFGSQEGYLMAGAWSVLVDGNVQVELYKAASNDERMIGWFTPRQAVVESWNPSCETYNLRLVNIKNGVETALYPACFSSAALDQDTSHLLYAVSDFNVNHCGCSKAEKRQGLYLIAGEGKYPRLVSTTNIYDLQEIPNANIFLAGGAQAWHTAYSADGEAIKSTEKVQGLQPVISTSSGRWAWMGTSPEGEKGVWIGTLRERGEMIFDGAVRSGSWSPDSQVLFFWTEEGFYQAGAPDFQAIKVENLPVTNAAWVIP